MRASRLRESVVLQSYNGSVWTDAATLPAEVLHAGTADDGASTSYQVTVRHTEQTEAILPTSELRPSHRLAWGSRTLEIFAVVHIEQHNRIEEIRLQCKELPAVAPE